MLHKIKLKEQFCDAVYEGRKKFEVRFNDRGYQNGDMIQFIPVAIENDHVIKIDHPIQTNTYKITYILSGNGIKENFVVLSIEEMR